MMSEMGDGVGKRQRDIEKDKQTDKKIDMHVETQLYNDIYIDKDRRKEKRETGAAMKNEKQRKGKRINDETLLSKETIP